MSFLAFYTASNIRKLDKMILGLLFGFTVVFESLLAFAQFLLHGSVGTVFYLLGERTFTSETPGIANASIHGALVLRPYGTFPHPNVLAAFLLLGILWVWYFLAKEKNKWMNTFLWIVTSCGSFGLLLTLSRITILLGVFLVALYTLWKLPKRYLLAFLGSTAILLFLFPTLFYRFAPRTFEESAAVRVQLASRAFSMVESHPLVGVGLNNFLSQLPSSNLIQPVHNVILLWLSETGLIGLMFASIFLLSVFKRCWRVWGLTQEKLTILPLFASALSMVVLGMFDHYFLTLQQGQLLFSFFIGLLASL